MKLLKFSETDKNNLRLVYVFAKKRKVKLYLVGGLLRDLMLERNKENPDYDFCLERSAINFGRKLARELKAGFVVLDREHGACRLVKKAKDKVYTLDFTDFRGKNLEEDLRHRDFTINAMALELEVIFKNRQVEPFLIDPFGGRQDLKIKLIKAPFKKVFVEDPLRILRAFSFSVLFGFKIDKETLKCAVQAKQKLALVSGERIRDELFKIFDSLLAYASFRKLDELKILKIIFPEIEKMRGVKQGPYHHLDIWKHTLETMRQLEALFLELKRHRDIQDYLDEVISSERRRKGLMKLGAFLHDIGKPDCLRRKDGKIMFHGHERKGADISRNIIRRLRLSNDEMDALQRMVFWHLRPGYLGDQEEVTPRAVFRYFRDTGSEAVSTLLLSIADQRSTRGRLTTKESRVQHERIAFGLIKEYFRRKKKKPLVRLINGHDLIRHFRLEPSPLIGKILSQIEELQAIGRIKNKRQAMAAAAKMVLEESAR
ncbi:MAG: HD domain-containing protein [Candidatus Omnitrophota bacterium]